MDEKLMRTPDEYEGELLCPRCGCTEAGVYYYICGDSQALYSHAYSCERYESMLDVCAACSVEMGWS